MQIMCIGQKDITPFKRRANKLPHLNWLMVDRDPSGAMLPEGGVNKEWIEKTIEEEDKYYKGTLDLVLFFVDSSDWTSDGILGYHLGNRYSGARVCLVKRRRRYYDTAEHEFWHAMWDYVYIHAGVNLENVLDVSEYGAIHGDDPRYEEYEYDWMYEPVLPHYLEALENDNRNEHKSLLLKYRALLRRQVVLLRNKLEVTHG